VNGMFAHCDPGKSRDHDFSAAPFISHSTASPGLHVSPHQARLALPVEVTHSSNLPRPVESRCKRRIRLNGGTFLDRPHRAVIRLLYAVWKTRFAESHASYDLNVCLPLNENHFAEPAYDA
jgi:hypothetical protein